MTTTNERPPLIVWDIIVSVVVWVFTGAFIVISALVALFGLAFLDGCPPMSCSAEGAYISTLVAAAASVVVALAGLIWGLVRILERQVSWWITVGAFVLCVVCWAVGFVGAAKEVGW